MHYKRQIPLGRDGRFGRRVPMTGLAWSSAMAYAVGLIATDGCLSQRRQAVTLVSGDRDLLEVFKRILPRAGRIGSHGQNAWHVYVSSVDFCRWLESIGLTPRKSLTMGAIDVPDEHFFDLARGLLDGDGSISNMILNPGGAAKRYPDYRYERINAVFHSASRVHVEWIRSSMLRLLGVHTTILVQSRRRLTSRIYTLRYGKHATLKILDRLYADPHAPCLERKRRIWLAYVNKPPLNSMQTRRSGVTVASMDSRSIGPKGP